MEKECWGVILAAGQGSRMLSATDGIEKQFLLYNGFPLWWNSAVQISKCPSLHGLVLVFPKSKFQEAKQETENILRQNDLGVKLRFAIGGTRRQDSVRNALSLLPHNCYYVLIHDGARPFVSTRLCTQLIESLKQSSVKGVIPAIAVTDTIKECSSNGIVLKTLNRDTLKAVQTPQAFVAEVLVHAHNMALEKNWEVTDDASLLEQCGESVLVINGEKTNIKITAPEDLALLKEKNTPLPISGYGYDVHAYGGNRDLRLGGIPIPSEYKISAHSDGDVLLHALMDALLGCIGKGDIGKLFPDTDPKYNNISSLVLLDHVLSLCREDALKIIHVDLTVIAQKPKLAPYAGSIRKNIADMLGLEIRDVAFKATTEEHLGFTGELRGIKAVALVSALSYRNKQDLPKI